MTEFLARVEVHDDHDYQALHREMESFGFRRYASATDGYIYQLPTGTYWISGDFTTRSVLGFVQTVLANLGVTGEVTVTQSAETWFSGLPLA